MHEGDVVVDSIAPIRQHVWGTVLIGVEDRTRPVRGVKEPLNLEERLANLIAITWCRGIYS